MEWWPELRFGWPNGWLFALALGLTDAVLFIGFPQEVVRRLFDRSGWSQQQIRFTAIGKLAALGCLLLLVFSPLRLDSFVFLAGVVVGLLGLVGLAGSLFDFRQTPLDEPVVSGSYGYSRNPQIISATLVLLGGCLAVGSWPALILLTLGRISGHYGLLAEEDACLRAYGDSYADYMARVPRYLLFR